MKKTLILIFLSISFLILSKGVYASGITSNLSGSVSPTINYITLDKGSNELENITYYNTSSVNELVYLYSMNFMTNINGNVTFSYRSVKGSSDLWVSFVKNSYLVYPHSKIDIPVYIKVPSYAIPGGHYVSVFFQVSSEGALTNSNVGVISRIAALFFININGNIFYNAEISSSVFNAPYWHIGSFYFPLFYIRKYTIVNIIYNKGNTYIDSLGNINIVNSYTNNRKSYTLPEHLILQGVARKLQTEINNHALNFGKYKITSTVFYGFKQNSKNGFIIFVFPLYVIFLLTGFLLLVILVVYKFIKKVKA